MKRSTLLHMDQKITDIPAFSHLRLKASSFGLDWQGLQLESGTNNGVDLQDLMVDGHFIAINLADTSLHFKMRNELDWKRARLPPSTLWINPEGTPYSLVHHERAYWAHCVVDGKYLDDIAGRHYELRGGIGIVDSVLAALFRVMIANLDEPSRYSKRLADEFIRSFIYALITRHGSAANEVTAKGGIAPAQLQSLLSWLEAHIEDPLTVAAMASRLGLSAAHFSREFKRSTGITPWGYFVRLRLDAARSLLDAGEPVGVAAIRTGFSDIAHLSRLFKHRFGVCPSAFARSGRSGVSERKADSAE